MDFALPRFVIGVSACLFMNSLFKALSIEWNVGALHEFMRAFKDFGMACVCSSGCALLHTYSGGMERILVSKLQD